MIAWCGPRRDGLSWLYNQLHECDDVNGCETIDLDSVDRLCSLAPRRLIFSVEARVDSPQQIIRHVERDWPEVPLAIAAGSWLDGSRRTGLGTTTQLCLPWYRWWDGWHQWLAHHHAGRSTSNAILRGSHLLDKWPRIAAALDSHAPCSPTFSQRGLIVGNCQESAQAWRCSLNSTYASVHLNVEQYRDWILCPDFSPDWILWDDSVQNSFHGYEISKDLHIMLNDASRKFPNALIVVASSMPRWSDWQIWREAGADELIAKPSFGLPLNTLLNDRLTRAESPQH